MPRLTRRESLGLGLGAGFAATCEGGAADVHAARKHMANEVMAHIRRLGTVASRIEGRIVVR
jgi:hypothetical protein